MARKVTIGKDSTTIITNAVSKYEVRSRIAQLKMDLSEIDVYDSEKLAERIAKLSSGVVVIKVGVATEIDLEDRKFCIEDVKNATIVAIEEGSCSCCGKLVVLVYPSTLHHFEKHELVHKWQVVIHMMKVKIQEICGPNKV
ncbi:hypothetical protein MKX01_004760 [Papaver californicum]|nr:hypothetical protein MKX01_004760 [Papaver californicum]